jgi:multicomponent Na+:H+ antiporter subunit C
VTLLPFLVAAWLLLAGLYGAATSRHLVHLVMCLSVMQSATVVLLIAIGYRDGAAAPFYADIKAGARVVDPVVQALTLTDIVVAVAVSALLLALALKVFEHHGSLDPSATSEMRG